MGMDHWYFSKSNKGKYLYSSEAYINKSDVISAIIKSYEGGLTNLQIAILESQGHVKTTKGYDINIHYCTCSISVCTKSVAHKGDNKIDPNHIYELNKYGLSWRIIYVLQKEGYQSIYQLPPEGERSKLLKGYGFGPKSLIDLNKALKKRQKKLDKVTWDGVKVLHTGKHTSPPEVIPSTVVALPRRHTTL